MKGRKDYFKEISGKSREKVFRRTSHKDSLNAMWTQSKSAHPILELGTGTLDQFLTEEERESHLHCLGSTGEGKSKFLELLMRHDINNGHGLCLLDPSAQGDTAYKVLKYCASIGHEKVLIIDPAHWFTHEKVIGLNPLHYEDSLHETSIAYLMDSVRVLFNQKDASDTPRIQKYLPALLSVLQRTGMTLHDTLYFTNYRAGENRRAQILHKAFHKNAYDRDALTLMEVFRLERDYQFLFSSTINRLEPFFRSEYLDMALGCPYKLDFHTLIRDGWVILVNLDSDSSLDTLGSRLLGSILINEILFAINRMRNHGWKGVYYLYVDEAGEYATRRLARILELKRKSGVRMIISHQHMGQFEDLRIASSIRTNAKMKIAFNIIDRKERDEAVKILYGGELTDRDVSYSLSKISKQQAVLKKPKQDAAIIDIPNVPDIDIDITDYLNTILSNAWYHHPSKIKASFHERFTSTAKVGNPPPPKQGKVSNSKPDSPPSLPEQGDSGDTWKRVSKDVSSSLPTPKGDGKKRLRKKAEDKS